MNVKRLEARWGEGEEVEEEDVVVGGRERRAVKATPRLLSTTKSSHAFPPTHVAAPGPCARVQLPYLTASGPQTPQRTLRICLNHSSPSRSWL